MCKETRGAVSFLHFSAGLEQCVSVSLCLATSPAELRTALPWPTVTPTCNPQSLESLTEIGMTTLIKNNLFKKVLWGRKRVV
jgi:hypothetical protein